MSIVPPPEAIAAMEAGSVTVTRRMEIYESDGVTRWYPGGDERSRFIAGGVSIDYSRDERRTVDLVLLNDDNALRPDPNTGLWYDKVFKLFRGVRYRTSIQSPSMVIIDDIGTGTAYLFRQFVMSLGFSRVDVNLDANTYEEVESYDIVIANRANIAITKMDILKAAYIAGRKVITRSDKAGLDLPFVTTASPTSGSVFWGITPVTNDIPIQKNWINQTTTGDAGERITATDGTAVPVATSLDGATTFFTAILAQHPSGGRWFHYSPPTMPTQGGILFKNGINWLRNYEAYTDWETQIGEFCIDNISEEDFPYTVQVSGRDYTKFCLNSKLEKAMSFEAGTDARELIVALATNSGIKKFKIPAFIGQLGHRMDYVPETARWEIMKNVSNAFNYDIFFDPQGYLTMRSFQDPSFSAVTASFSTGVNGNLVKYRRSINDSRLYNHVIVTAEVEGSEGLPYWGEARNNEPGSPTRLEKIGDRPYFISNPALDSDIACQEYAMSQLKYIALESYDFSFDAITYPWLDVGDICNLVDPRGAADDPYRFLMDTINIPMTLGPMSLTAKRVTFITDKTLVNTDTAATS